MGRGLPQEPLVLSTSGWCWQAATQSLPETGDERCDLALGQNMTIVGSLWLYPGGQHVRDCLHVEV